jgi:hypothetical protein
MFGRWGELPCQAPLGQSLASFSSEPSNARTALDTDNFAKITANL